MEFLNYLPDSILFWLLDHGVKIVLILVGTYITHKFAHILIAKGIRKAVTTDKDRIP